MREWFCYLNLQFQFQPFCCEIRVKKTKKKLFVLPRKLDVAKIIFKLV